MTPPGTRRCLSCDSTVGRVSTSPFLYNNSIDKSRTLRNADKAQGATLVTRQAKCSWARGSCVLHDLQGVRRVVPHTPCRPAIVALFYCVGTHACGLLLLVRSCSFFRMYVFLCHCPGVLGFARACLGLPGRAWGCPGVSWVAPGVCGVGRACPALPGGAGGSADSMELHEASENSPGSLSWPRGALRDIVWPG